jgi:hypothetical protein
MAEAQVSFKLIGDGANWLEIVEEAEERKPTVEWEGILNSEHRNPHLQHFRASLTAFCCLFQKCKDPEASAVDTFARTEPPDTQVSEVVVVCPALPVFTEYRHQVFTVPFEDEGSARILGSFGRE